MFSKEEIDQIETLSLEQSLFKLCEIIPTEIVFSTSLGQEDQIITDIIFKSKLPIKIFTLDTGRLFYEHYELLANNNSKYKTKTEVYFPDANEVEKFVNEKNKTIDVLKGIMISAVVIGHIAGTLPPPEL